MPTVPAAVVLVRQRAQIGGLLDARTNSLVQWWGAAWGDVSADLGWRVDNMLREFDRPGSTPGSIAWRLQRAQQAEAALEYVTQRLESVSPMMAAGVRDDLAALLGRAERDQRDLLAAQLPPDFRQSFYRISPAAIDAISARALEQVTVRAWQLSAAATSAMKQALVRGVAVGQNPRVIAARMVATVGGEFNGGLPRALVIARTESLDAYRTATQETLTANRDLVDGWEWVCACSPRSCPACWGMDGTIHPLTEPGPLDHHQGRCIACPALRPWSDLGIDLPELPDVRPPASELFGRLEPSQQARILGPGRFEAWQSGRLPMSSWAQRVESPDWRPYYTSAPVPPGRLGGRTPPPGGGGAPTPAPPPPPRAPTEAARFHPDTARSWSEAKLDAELGRLLAAGDTEAVDAISHLMDLMEEARRVELAAGEAMRLRLEAETVAYRERQAAVRRLTPTEQARADFDAYLETSYLQADADLNGVLVNREGLARGISARSLFSGSDSRALKYATEELRAWFQANGRYSWEAWKYQARAEGARGSARGRAAAEAARKTHWDAPAL